jgi:hypothetical protein
VRIQLLCLSLFGVLACASSGRSPAAAEFRIVPLADRYEPGGTIRVSLINETDAVVYQNSCKATLQRRTDRGTWTDAGGLVCPSHYVPGFARLGPAATAHYDVPTPPSMPPGEYRIVLDLRHEDDSPLPPEHCTSGMFIMEETASPARGRLSRTARAR